MGNIYQLTRIKKGFSDYFDQTPHILPVLPPLWRIILFVEQGLLHGRGIVSWILFVCQFKLITFEELDDNDSFSFICLPLAVLYDLAYQLFPNITMKIVVHCGI
jgi:hypothetical protein